MKTITGYKWYDLIGIVTTTQETIVLGEHTTVEKAYIGVGKGVSVRDDLKHIVNLGFGFPLSMAKQIIQDHGIVLTDKNKLPGY